MAKTPNLTQQQGRSSVTLEVAVRGEGFDRAKLILPVNPTEVAIERPSRQSVTQTLTGTYQDHLGAGVTTVRIAGTTGWRGRNGSADGYDAIKKLRDLLRTYDELVSQGDPTRVEMRCLLNMPEGWEHFLVSKDTWTVSRNNREPLLWRYTINFIVLRDEFYPNIADPAPNFVVSIPTPLPSMTIPMASLSVRDTGASNGGGGGNGGSGTGTGQGGGTGDGTIRTGGTTDTVDPRDESERDRRRREAMVGMVNPYFDDHLGYDNYTYYTFDLEAGNIPSTVGGLADLLYPSAGSTQHDSLNKPGITLYPSNMYPYILAANRNYFIVSLNRDTPLPRYGIVTQADIDSGRDLNFITLRIPRVSAGTANPAMVAANLGAPFKSIIEQGMDAIGSLFTQRGNAQYPDNTWSPVNTSGGPIGGRDYRVDDQTLHQGEDVGSTIGLWLGGVLDWLTKPGPV